MIGVPQSAAELEAPAKSFEELSERLTPHIGQIISMDIDFVGEREIVTARLERVSLHINSRNEHTQFSVQIVLSGEGTKERYCWMTSRYRVLCDGIWNVVHEPKNREN